MKINYFRLKHMDYIRIFQAMLIYWLTLIQLLATFQGQMKGKLENILIGILINIGVKMDVCVCGMVAFNKKE